MGRWVNRPVTTYGGWAVSLVVVGLNAALLVSLLGG
jgi:Mn2+/Fe2+ NRAMP family transporter